MNRQVSGWIAHRRIKWLVLVISLLIVGSVGSFGSKLSAEYDNDVASFLPGDAESTKVIAELESFNQDTAIPLILLAVRDGGLTPADQAYVTQAAQEVAGLKDFDGQVLGPIPSENGEAIQAIVKLSIDEEAGFEAIPDDVSAARKAFSQDAPDGLRLELAGPAALAADQAKAFAGIDGILLLSAIGVVVVLLLLTYRSPILWIIPLFCGVASVFTAQGVVYLLAKYADLTVNGQSGGILSVLVLGASIDYALLLVARYREELANYADRHEAMAHALHRAAPAILASGATVVIGLLCLSLADLNSTSGLGPVAACGIVLSLFMMLVLLPALLVIVGRWAFWPFIPRLGDADKSDTKLWARVGRGIARRPRIVWVGTTLALAAACFGIVKLDANGLSNEEQFTTTQPSIEASKVLARYFDAGTGSPLLIVADAASTDQVTATLASVEGVDGATITPTGQAGDRVALEATLTDAADSPAAAATVERARAALADAPGNALVGGDTALNLDVKNAASRDNQLLIPLILGVVLLILIGLLRAIVAPLILLATVVLSFGAALGISALVFRYVFDFAGADTTLPLFAFVFLVALGIDYNIFLMTRVREEALVHGTRRGALIGLTATGGVITSAGLVLAGTFAALGSLPLVFLAELGFAVALGVLLDTIIVRSVLVTALNLDVGRHMWWPSALGKKEDPAPVA